MSLQPLSVRVLRELNVDARSHPRGQPHLSAASGLVQVHDRLYVIADDEHHLGVFTTVPDEPGRLVRILEGDLPMASQARKALKPDIEALALLPAFADCPQGALLALGSGSRPRRNAAVLIALDARGDPCMPVRQLSLDRLYESLRSDFDELNIEGAFVAGNEFMLLQRANKRDRCNACIRFAWTAVAAWLAGEDGAAPRPSRIVSHDLGDIDGIPLSFTDGAALQGGAWVFSAVAEDTSDAYEDGACHGAAVGVIDDEGSLRSLQVLPQRWKVEGVAARRQGDKLALSMVTDADDPAQPSKLLTTQIGLST